MVNLYLIKYRLKNRDKSLIQKITLLKYTILLILVTSCFCIFKPMSLIQISLISKFNDFSSKNIIKKETAIAVSNFQENIRTPLNGVLTNGYGNGHTGVDIQGKHHDNIIVIDSGIVTFAGSQNGYGNCIEVKHTLNGETYYSFYAHLSKILVSNGQTVTKGSVIGIEGGSPGVDPNPGNSTGHHLHFEIRKYSGYGNDVNPFNNKWFKLSL